MQALSPIGKLISLTYQKNGFLDNSILKEKIENIVDLIKIKTQTRGVEHSSQAIQNDLFDIRIDLLGYLSEQPQILKEFEKIILEEIANKYYLSGHHKKLGETLSNSLEVYFKIFSHLSNLISKEEGNPISLSITNEIGSLNSLKNLLKLHPSKEFENYILWLESSLNFDYSLIASDLVINDILYLNKKSLSELEAYIKKSIIEFGSYSMLTSFWTPEVDDEEQYIRNIKIKAAVLEIQNGKSISFSSEALHQLMAS